MSRLRLAFLFVLVTTIALPTSAHARRIPYCHLFSPEAVGRAVDYRGITVKGQETSAPVLTGLPMKGRMSVCAFWSGRDQLAESTVMTFKTPAATSAEFKGQLKTRAASHPRRVNGPWDKAYMISNNEIFVLKGRHIFHLGYEVTTTKATGRAVIGFGKSAARKL